jgi:chorismate mutase/prephenate dehydratase
VSRRAHRANWHSAFYIDVSGQVDAYMLLGAFLDIDASAGAVRVLGSYPVALP